MKKPLIIIGHRMGQGFNVKKGIEDAGGEAIVIEGMGADMKLGEIMNENDADLGISFCGSGGAGALTAETDFGYSSRHHMRSIQEGTSAVEDGIEALGFGFMDTEELGREITKAWFKTHGQE